MYCNLDDHMYLTYKYCNLNHRVYLNRNDGVMVSVLPSSAVDRGFEPQSGEIKD